MRVNPLQTVTFRDYLRIYFRHKPVIVVTFLSILGAMYFAVLAWTPIYEAEVNLLITAQKKIEASYYQDAGQAYGMGESTVALTQSEIMASNPVLQRAVEVLKLYERPQGYEKRFASPFKVSLLNLQERLRKDLRRMLKKGAPGEKSREMLIQEAVEELRKSIEISSVKSTNMLRLTVKDYDPQAAAKIANVISRSYVIFDLEQQLAEYQLKYGQTHEIVRQLWSDVDKLIYRITQEPRSVIESIGPASVKIIAPAYVPQEPQKFLGKKRVLIAFLVLFIAAFASLSLAMFFDYMDQTFKSPREITSLLDVPYLGFVPRTGLSEAKLIPQPPSGSIYQRSYAKLSDQMFLRLKDHDLRTVLLTSTLTNEGTDVVAANLGLSFARRFSQNTLIIDADLRNPSMSRWFGLPSAPGLAEVLAGKDPLAGCLKEVEPNLSILGAGDAQEDPLVLLTSPKLLELIQHAKKKFAVVLIHTPPLDEYKDAELISSHVDTGLYVIAEGRTRRQVVMHALAAWRNPRFNWLGVILNHRRLVIPAFLYPWT
jgi:capsular exopolysaccharide synthesis family protein